MSLFTVSIDRLTLAEVAVLGVEEGMDGGPSGGKVMWDSVIERTSRSVA